ncbi:hypothetical protein KIH74_04260 [Kineosporia sp. J2-2]|uniref:Uncharacterized protein n=1 Tax=Kineosporia corallincola TaxID=2835133 RepID=A0ABS5TAN4_9ACTN|nr:hypothetical protein [Kineosporia corallincola]MBT0768121.1 hypothetical protein [Kineosporia corallincola]
MTAEKQTFIQDADAAQNSLVSMAAQSRAMNDKLTSIVSRIKSLEAGKPWGDTEEYGKPFEQQYQNDGQGSDFIRDQVGIIAEQTEHGTRLAYQAIRDTVQLDEDGAALFKVAGSENVGSTVKDTLDDQQKRAEEQQKQSGK